MEECQGGWWEMDYGDMSCEEFWFGVGSAITIASPYASVALPGWGTLISIGLGLGAGYAGASC
jgi:hypothetical protein